MWERQGRQFVGGRRGVCKGASSGIDRHMPDRSEQSFGSHHVEVEKVESFDGDDLLGIVQLREHLIIEIDNSIERMRDLGVKQLDNRIRFQEQIRFGFDDEVFVVDPVLELVLDHAIALWPG